MTDTRIDDLVFKFLEPIMKYRINCKPIFIQNIRKKHNGRSAIHINENKILNTLNESIKRNKYFMLCIGCPQKAKRYYDMLCNDKNKDKFVIINDENDVANKQLDNKFIICNPTDACIDFRLSNPVDIYLLPNDKNLNLMYILEQLYHAKKIDLLYFCFSKALMVDMEKYLITKQK